EFRRVLFRSSLRLRSAYSPPVVSEVPVVVTVVSVAFNRSPPGVTGIVNASGRRDHRPQVRFATTRRDDPLGGGALIPRDEPRGCGGASTSVGTPTGRPRDAACSAVTGRRQGCGTDGAVQCGSRKEAARCDTPPRVRGGVSGSTATSGLFVLEQGPGRAALVATGVLLES